MCRASKSFPSRRWSSRRRVVQGINEDKRKRKERRNPIPSSNAYNKYLAIEKRVGSSADCWTVRPNGSDISNYVEDGTECHKRHRWLDAVLSVSDFIHVRSLSRFGYGDVATPTWMVFAADDNAALKGFIKICHINVGISNRWRINRIQLYILWHLFGEY